MILPLVNCIINNAVVSGLQTHSIVASVQFINAMHQQLTNRLLDDTQLLVNTRLRLGLFNGHQSRQRGCLVYLKSSTMLHAH